MGLSTPLGIATLVRFWSDDEGLVTLEWVGLAAAVVVLAFGVISVVQGPVNTAVSTIGTKVVSTQSPQDDELDNARSPCSAPGLVIAASRANSHASLCQGR